MASLRNDVTDRHAARSWRVSTFEDDVGIVASSAPTRSVCSRILADLTVSNRRCDSQLPQQHAIVMQIEMNFLEDIREGLAHELRRLGYSPRTAVGHAYNDAHQMYVDHDNAMSRRIRPTSRMVQVSRQLLLRESSLPVSVRGGLLLIAYDLLRGLDVSPRLSRGLKKRDAKDDLLNEWGLHHLHLGDKMENDGYVSRTDDVLFLLVRRHRAYLIDVRPHGSWADNELVEIIHTNWPEEIAAYRSNASRLAHDISPLERRQLRAAGCNSPFQTLDGTIYGAMGGGLTGIRSNAATVVRGDHKLRSAQAIESHLRTQQAWLTEVVEHELGHLPERVSLHLLQLNPDHALVFVKNGFKEFAFKVPIQDAEISEFHL